jgi:DNA-binding transcriptional MerR regulator
MSKYTTGELAKLCGVSVRTVQYYDERNILVPSELSEGGRRLYGDEDAKRLKAICFLREAGVSINSISQLFNEDDPDKVISTLIEERENEARRELADCKKKIDMLEGIKKELRGIGNFSVESIGDIAEIMKSKDQLTKMRLTMVLTGVPVTALQWVSIILWITVDLWWLFPVWVAVAAIWGVWVSKYYFGRVAYICPECHETFKPGFKEAFFANHTPTLRKLTCPKCGKKSFCIEIYHKEDKKNA